MTPGGSSRDRDATRRAGVGVALAAGVATFVAFTAAVLIDRATGPWPPVSFPRHIYGNAVVLLAASAIVEGARAMRRRGRFLATGWLLAAAAGSGLVFLAGQLVGWHILAERGVSWASGGRAAMFYALSTAHGALTLSAIAALGLALRRAVAAAAPAGRLIDGATAYWHLIGGAWWYALLLLSALR